MAKLFIKKEFDTPGVSFDSDQKMLILDGKSLPEDSVAFYEPILDVITEFFSSGSVQGAIFEMKLTYFNTATSKQLLTLILDFVKNGGIIYWYYLENDEDVVETGKDFIDVIKDQSRKHGFHFEETNFKFIIMDDE